MFCSLCPRSLLQHTSAVKAIGRAKTVNHAHARWPEKVHCRSGEGHQPQPQTLGPHTCKDGPKDATRQNSLHKRQIKQAAQLYAKTRHTLPTCSCTARCEVMLSPVSGWQLANKRSLHRLLMLSMTKLPNGGPRHSAASLA